MKPWQRRIEHDTFDIAARLRSIDEGYFVVYDTRKGVYEVHNARQRGDTFALTVPYPSLDARTVSLVRRTRAERAAALWRELEEENARRERQARRKQIEDAAVAAGL